MKDAMNFNTITPPVSNFGKPEAERTLILTPVSLFRYSAATFNAHKIHYDFEYAKTVENYPGNAYIFRLTIEIGILVHGPFTSSLLMAHFVKAFPGYQVSQWNYRALYPIFLTKDEVEIKFCAKMRENQTHCDLWAETATGAMAMSGVVTFEPAQKKRATKKSKSSKIEIE
jgi:hydroxyacyl-ACP dehydratase HTD2-like protein with hotdog domain